MRRCYFSRNYKNFTSAGSKAKTDIEKTMSMNEFINIGFEQSSRKNKIAVFFIVLGGIIKTTFSLRKGDIIVVQYPLKKYFTFICRMAHLRKAKVVTVIHDLGSFRRKKLTIPKEIKRIGHSDFIITHNQKMQDWLTANGCQCPMNNLEIFDFLSDNTAPLNDCIGHPRTVSYAGALNYRKNKFLYDLQDSITSYRFDLYGGGFDEQNVSNKQAFNYKGFVHFEDLIKTPSGDFGLVWDGDSIDTCSGTFGEYLQYNNPHKTSLYIRCHLPVIIWKKAALADFITSNKIGFTIDSLKELNDKISAISDEEYSEMKTNATRISSLIKEGHYFMQAYLDAEEYLSSKVG